MRCSGYVEQCAPSLRPESLTEAKLPESVRKIADVSARRGLVQAAQHSPGYGRLFRGMAVA
jgi:hypothetical protein